MKKVYLCGPMQGLTVAETVGWRQEATKLFENTGIEVLDPLRTLRDFYHAEHIFSGEGETTESDHPGSRRFNYRRDLHDVRTADGVLAVFKNTKRVSIGSNWEMAWAAMYHKPLIVVLQNDNHHDHLFVREAASAITNNLYQGYKMMKDMLNA